MASTVLSDLPRGDPERTAEEFLPPAASFAHPSSIAQSKRLAYEAGKMFLGVANGRILEVPGRHGPERHVAFGDPIGVADDRHMVTVAGTRAGKGRAAIVPNMLLYPGSVLATDPKGELATITARHRKDKLGQSVHVLDPFETTRGAAAGLRCSFNPIMAMRPDQLAADGKTVLVKGSLVEDAALIADALVVVSETDSHWDESARTFIEGVILHVRTAPIYEGFRSLTTVQKLIARGAIEPGKTDDQGRPVRTMDALKAAMRSNPSADGIIADAAADFFERPDRERDSVLSTARRHLKFLNYSGIRRVSEGHDFDLTDLKKNNLRFICACPHDISAPVLDGCACSSI